MFKSTYNTQHGTSTLGHAIASGNPVYVKQLLNDLPQKDVLEVSRLGRTFLHTASDLGDVKMVRLLLGRGIDVNAVDSGKWTALHFAADAGSQRICKLLIDDGADVNAKTEDCNWTPLHLSASKGHAKLVSQLLEFGADVNALTSDKWTPLLLASNAGHYATCKYLIGANADINCTDPTEMETALHKACRNGHEKIAKLLIENGSRMTLDRLGLSPVCHAIACNFGWKISIECADPVEGEKVDDQKEDALH
jgi:ankyrin repeat protein